jgi:hypothetical protein
MAAGKEIKRLRGSISAQQAANFIGVDVARLRKWEQRDADPKDSGDINKVETYFGCKLKDLKNLDSFQFIKKNENEQNMQSQVDTADCEEIKVEVKYLKQIVDKLEKTIEDKNEIISLQRQLIRGEDKSKSSA